MAIEAYAFTDKGGRGLNEDHVSYRIEGDRAIFVVADGLGGHSAGEVASAMAVDDLLEAWGTSNAPVDGGWLERQVLDLNDRMVARQRELGNHMRTTVVVLALEGGKACWAHVGDSRLYHLHGGALASVTRDHSVAYTKYRSGEIAREQIGMDPDQSRLLSTLGSSDVPRVDCESWDGLAGTQDSFLLCTDGVWEYLRDMEILVDRLKSKGPKEWAQHCLFRMLDRVTPDHDNLSLLTVTIDEQRQIQ